MPDPAQSTEDAACSNRWPLNAGHCMQLHATASHCLQLPAPVGHSLHLLAFAGHCSPHNLQQLATADNCVPSGAGHHLHVHNLRELYLTALTGI